MKQYLLSVYHPEGNGDFSEADMEGIFRDVGTLNDELQAEGAWVFAGGLHPTSTATVLRVAGGEVLTTDGPFVQTREHLAGYYIIEARDLAEAIQVASGIPGAKVGCVEVRPIAEDERTAQALG